MAKSGTAMPELPGFTYDEERRRYVRILADHHAGHLGGAAKAASASAVRDVSAYRSRCRVEEEQKASISKVQIQKSRIHKHPIIGMSLDCQMGVQKCFSDAHGEAWAHLIDPGWDLPIDNPSSLYMMKKTMQGDAFVGVFHQQSRSTGSGLQIMFNTSPWSTLRHCLPQELFSRVTSLSLTEKYMYLTPFYRYMPNKVFLIPTADYDMSDILENPYDISKANNQHDYWCTSFHPNTSQPQIAVGSEGSILVHDPFCSHGHGLREYKTSAASSPTLSIQWKSENIIAAGLRDTTVHLFDVRARGGVFRLRHSQAVMRLHCPDENKLLLAGPKRLSMYDLRYNKTPHQQRASRPWFHYHNYDNTRWNPHDMDISPRLGLLALALETTTEIWNLWTGTKVRQLYTSSVSPHHVEKSKVVMFTRSNHSPQFFTEESDPTGLLVVGSNSVREWSLDNDGRRPVFDNVSRQANRQS